ncbi:MAG: transposase [Bacteroidota bacterium]
MAKLINLRENISRLNLFFPHHDKELYWNEFLWSNLGQVYQSIPWDELVPLFSTRKDKRGRKGFFSTQGKLGLMFLKSYTKSSDEKLIERLNTDYSLQLFCGIYLMPGEKIKDVKLPSKIRCELAGKLGIHSCQKALAAHWKPWLDNTSVLLEDATCYETDMRPPTNVKLLWECNDWVYNQVKLLCKYMKVRRPRSKFDEQKQKYLNYQRSRKKTHKKGIRRVKSLLYLLEKLWEQLAGLEAQAIDSQYSFPLRYYKRTGTIRKILSQQQEMYETGKTVPGRIVSIAKDYIRPIVRGKETKQVEFGPKVNMVQVDGINFIDHLSFDAFNECKRFIPSIRLCRELFGKTTHAAGDAIYATNENRKYCTLNNITTSFKRKGKAGKHEQQRQQIQSILSTERATRMEGSFGAEKRHYGLGRIKARIKPTEILWVFFGVHTANAQRIATKRKEKLSGQKAA